MNWHGKPIGDKSEVAIKAIEAQMSDTNGPYKLVRPEVVEDAKHFAPETIKLSAPPSYKLGEKVHSIYFPFQSLFLFNLFSTSCSR